MTGPEHDADIRALVEIGDTIAAIRLHRERHGGSLTDARAAIEAIRWAITQARGSELGGLGRELDELLRRGDRITAIRRHREATGCSLKEAMDAIEARLPSSPAQEPAPAPSIDDIDEAIRAGQKILAIKRWRERTGCGLVEAKAAVEARLAEIEGATAPPRPAEPPRVNELQPELDRLISAAEFIPAVQHYQARTGAGVQDAIAAVDARRLALFKVESAERAAQAPAEVGLQPELDRLIQARELINAIKHYRQVTGRSLKECKDAVDARAAELGVRR